MSWFPRALGAATAVYSAAVIAKPQVLTGPTGLGDSPASRTLGTAVGVRDLVSGLAVALAPSGVPLRLALLTRVAMDIGDSVVLGLAAPDRATRAKVVGIALGWAAINALALLATRAKSADDEGWQWDPRWSDPSYWADPASWDRVRGDQAV
ncbi:hypothetical protein [Umezawaea sp. Da 62-37]|uniref:hypothetical protein n=1 Tax=Umezawaea sp. Da 62-37 TaxID=3075927 RepID=UPI0028F6C6A5|nr:hypothetical protein [Umezawaea sp. Da 62-37]WNV89206.1 hypothetical protein RM788_13155 [Umezawaea sp. Da 62-37]